MQRDRKRFSYGVLLGGTTMIPKAGKTGSIAAITTSVIIFVLLILLFSIETPTAFCEINTGEDKETGAEWYDGFIFEDASFATQLTRALSWTYVQSADVGEVIKTARRIKDGDIYSWYDEWYKEANRILDLAEKWEKEEHATSASEAYFRATTYFQSAGFYMVAPQDRDRARDCRKRSRATFLKAIEAYPNISYVEIPYGDVVMPGYFAQSEKTGNKTPIVIVNTGFDGSAEDSFNGVAWAAMKRGYDCLVFEGPGQGELFMEKDLYFRHDWEVVGKAVLDYVETLPGVNHDKIVYMGVSMGGYLAPRVAAFDDRVDVLVVNSGLFKLYECAFRIFPDDVTQLIDTDPPKFNGIVEEAIKDNVSLYWLFHNAVWRWGFKDFHEFMLSQRDYTLEHVVTQIKCPALVTESEDDGMFAGQPEQLYNALQCEKAFIHFTREEAAQAHCQLGESSLSNEKLFNWIDSVIKPDQDKGFYKFHHLGVIVNDMDQAVQIFSDILGLDPADERIDRFQGKANKTAMVPIGRYEDFNQFELMEPLSENWLDSWIKTEKGAGFLHMAILVDDFDGKVEQLRLKGFTVHVEESVDPFPGCPLLREAYILPKDASRGVLIDLMDAENFPVSLGGLAPDKKTDKE